ncbi:MAG: DUF1598 domain-containing protein [Phycisphaerae bacterium]|nr:DUF1598 domain-containing protein [Phycisphaerae bacterium]
MARRSQFGVWATGLVLIVVALLTPAHLALAQPVPTPTPTPTPAGVYIDPEGMVRNRQTEVKPDLAVLKARAKAAEGENKGPLTYVSLPRLLNLAAELTKAGKPLPMNVRCMGGLTQLQYVFVYPKDKDLVLAGRGEEIDAANPLVPVGKASGRPVLQLDDLITAIRTVNDPRGAAFFGCTMDPAPDVLQKMADVVDKFGNKSRAELAKRVADAVGPQKVTVFGTAADTRLAYAMVAADFKLKRMFLGLETSPVAPTGNTVGGAPSASNRFWFEACYEPLLVSADGEAYAIRGQRLQVKAGATAFDARGATKKAQTFADKFTKNVPALAATIPAFADLQNVADLGLLAALIRKDKLDQKVGMDLAGVLKVYRVEQVVVPRAAETQVTITNGSLASGGVGFSLMPLVADTARQQDTKGDVATLKQRPSEDWWFGPTAK